MSAKRLAVLVMPVFVLIACAQAQVNELSVTFGRSFVSTETIVNPPPGDPTVHFANEETIEFNYARRLLTHKSFGFFAEVPVAIYPHMEIHTFAGNTPHDIGALFVTPSARVNFFSNDAFTPWASVGGGYGRFRESSNTLFQGPNPGPTGTNTGVFQFGGGLDVWIWHHWGAKFEARDFWSGKPALNVETSNSRQHNYYVGVGVMHRF